MSILIRSSLITLCALLSLSAVLLTPTTASAQSLSTHHVVETAESDPAAKKTTSAPVTKRPEGVPEGAAEVVFAGGCFWCVEAVFEELDGVYEAISGYAGGDAATANYEAVSSGKTKHAEVVKIYYDPKKISFQTLLEVHFVTHDPTTLNRQGADIGTQYRSAVFFATEAERSTARAYIASLELSGEVVTTLEPLEAFYEAEKYHQNFVCENPYQGYVQGVALPKVKKVRDKFKRRLKKKSPISL